MEKPLIVDQNEMRRVALFWPYEKPFFIGFATLLVGVLLSLPFLPNSKGHPHDNSPSDFVFLVIAVIFLIVILALPFLDVSKRHGACFLWNDQGFALERHGKIEWQMPWNDYAGLKRSRIFCHLTGKVIVKSKTSQGCFRLPLKDTSTGSSEVVLRLLTHAATDPEQVQNELIPEPKKPTNRYIIGVFAVAIVLMAVGLPTDIKLYSITNGLSEIVLTRADQILAFLSLCIGPALFLGAIGLIFRKKGKGLETPMPQAVEWNLSDALTYGVVPNSPLPGTVFSYGDKQEPQRILKSYSTTYLVLPVFAAVVSPTVGIGLGREVHSVLGWIGASLWMLLWMTLAVLLIRDRPSVIKCLSTLDIKLRMGNNEQLEVILDNGWHHVRSIQPARFSDRKVKEISRIIKIQIDTETLWISPALLKPQRTP